MECLRRAVPMALTSSRKSLDALALVICCAIAIAMSPATIPTRPWKGARW